MKSFIIALKKLTCRPRFDRPNPMSRPLLADKHLASCNCTKISRELLRKDTLQLLTFHLPFQDHELNPLPCFAMPNFSVQPRLLHGFPP